MSPPFLLIAYDLLRAEPIQYNTIQYKKGRMGSQPSERKAQHHIVILVFICQLVLVGFLFRTTHSDSVDLAKKFKELNNAQLVMQEEVEAVRKKIDDTIDALRKCDDTALGGFKACGFLKSVGVSLDSFLREVDFDSTLPASATPKVAVSLATFGPVELTLDALDNIVRYTMSDTVVAVHVSAVQTPYNSAGIGGKLATHCISDRYPRRVIVTPHSLPSRRSSAFVMLSHLLNYVTLRAAKVHPSYIVFVPNNSRLFQPGLECLVTYKKVSQRYSPTTTSFRTAQFGAAKGASEKPAMLRKMFGQDNISLIPEAHSNHEGIFFPGYFISEVIESLDARGITFKEWNNFNTSPEEWFLQSYLASGRYPEFQDDRPVVCEERLKHPVCFSQKSVCASQAVTLNLYHCTGRNPQCGEIREVLRSDYYWAFKFFNDCSRLFPASLLSDLYGSAVVGIKRTGDHAGDFVSAIANAAPAVGSNATVVDSCAGPLWAGPRLSKDEYFQRSEKSFQGYLDMLKSFDPEDCVHESDFYAFKSDVALPNSCIRLLTSKLAPAWPGNIMRNTSKCRNSPYFWDVPDLCRGRYTDNKAASKMCDGIKKKAFSAVLGRLEAFPGREK